MKRQLLAALMLCSLGASAQQPADPNVARAEKMFGFVLANQADSLYNNLSEKVKPMVQKNQLEGLLQQTEALAGKYQKHSDWEVQEVMGMKAYVSMAQFEKMELGALVVFDEDSTMLAIQLVPAEAVKNL